MKTAARFPLTQVALDSIRPNPAQPRQFFDQERLDELARSLREHGLLQPILVRPLDEGGYEIVAGERRWQAARRAGLVEIAAVVVPATSGRALELALVENVQRADLTPLEEAEAYRAVMATLGLTQERLASRLGISRAAVANRLRLLALGPRAREALAEGRITEGHARALLPLPPDRQDEAVRLVVDGALSVRQAELLARRLSAQSRQRRTGLDDAATVLPEPDYAADAMAEALRRALGARVRVRRSGGGVSVLMHFHSMEAAQAALPALVPDAGQEDWE